MTPSRTISSDRGSSTVLVAALVVTTAVLGLATVGAHSALAARSRAAGAADASALAAADVVAGVSSGSACARAESVAASNSVALDSCLVTGAEATVEVSTTVGPVPVRARSTAGPPPRDGPSRGRAP